METQAQGQIVALDFFLAPSLGLPFLLMSSSRGRYGIGQEWLWTPPILSTALGSWEDQSGSPSLKSPSWQEGGVAHGQRGNIVLQQPRQLPGIPTLGPYRSKLTVVLCRARGEITGAKAGLLDRQDWTSVLGCLSLGLSQA